MLKRYELHVESPTKTKWTKAFVRHLRDHVIPELELVVGTKLKLLLDRFDMYAPSRLNLIRRSRCSRKPYATRLLVVNFVTFLSDRATASNCG